MSLFRPASVKDMPEVFLSRWHVTEASNGTETTLHFVGYNSKEGYGMVSSPIVEFDSTKKCGKTQSGRVYQLVGQPGFNVEADYVWQNWKEINNITESQEINIFEQFVG
jgi:hypothetical protein